MEMEYQSSLLSFAAVIVLRTLRFSLINDMLTRQIQLDKELIMERRRQTSSGNLLCKSTNVALGIHSWQ